ncbi:SURF1 family protein [Sapientia aquatica]|uniref:SURF1-like protein n=1 Tax=Sapientia aquatica TaxID=1549640 RepID=A0A4R5W2P9_9BURK|nr:SURF1 family protein [Sapientia aquatica]TDK66632.1 SURF1 family protein [Sapientia aquatica]
MLTFRFRLVPFIATLLLFALGCSLSYWQTQRAKTKEAIEAKLLVRESTPAVLLPPAVDVSQMEYTRVTLIGEFVADWPLYLDNRPMNGVAGIYVLMPFKLQGENKVVLVERGWLPRNSTDRATIKPYRTPSGIIQIEGALKASGGHVLQLGQSAPLQPKALVQNIEINAFNAASKFNAEPFFIEQTKGPEDGLQRDWPRASMGSERHRGYAFQWLALAVMALLFFLVTGFKGGKKQ